MHLFTRVHTVFLTQESDTISVDGWEMRDSPVLERPLQANKGHKKKTNDRGQKAASTLAQQGGKILGQTAEED